MMKKVKVGIVGLGELGSVHAENLRFKIPNAELVAICGILAEKEKLEKRKAEWDIPYCFYDFEEMVKLQEIEAVVISSSTAAHHAHALAAIQAGKHVFIEKPTGLNEQECMEIEQAAAASDKIFTVGFMRRHDPSYAEAKRRIDAGEIGTPILFRG
ncbi:MAG: Gfo/Idh/MocA family oxidoreductase, partial [Eubacteriales bacterium]|nr:Gfo/Idh/MocA family oxidoreductase [Eubacteriales bacterium]